MAKLKLKPLLQFLAALPRRSLRFAKLLIPRAYALAMLGLLCTLTFMALRYLYVALVTPATAPAQITALPTRLTADLLDTPRSDWQALDATDTPRTPPSHYHRIDGWVAPDRVNDCTRSGCHSPIPHTRNKVTRAFLNMHSTSIHCGVCHMTGDERPRPLAWYELEEGRVVEPPAILQAYGMIASADAEQRWAKATSDDQKLLVRRLRDAARQSPAGNAITTLAEHFEAVAPRSPMFQSLLVEARASLPRHFRGEYGAKLAMKSADGHPILGHPGTEQVVQTYLARREGLDKQAREQLLEKVHPLRRKEALSCGECHTPSDSLIDFKAAGFPQPRIDAMVAPIVVRMTDHLRRGDPAFTMPEFTSPEPTTQP